MEDNYTWEEPTPVKKYRVPKELIEDGYGEGDIFIILREEKGEPSTPLRLRFLAHSATEI